MSTKKTTINANASLFASLAPVPTSANRHTYGAKPQREEKKIECISAFPTSYVTKKGVTKYALALVPYPSPNAKKWKAFCELYTGTGNPYMFHVDGMLCMLVNRSANEGKDMETRASFADFIQSEASARNWKIVSEKDMRKLHEKALAKAHKAQEEHKKETEAKAIEARKLCADI